MYPGVSTLATIGVLILVNVAGSATFATQMTELRFLEDAEHE